MKKEKLDFIQITYSIVDRLAEKRIMPVAAEETAMSASCRASGLGTTAQSPYTSTRSCRSMRNTEDTILTPGRVFTNSSAGRMVFGKYHGAAEAHV